MFSIIPDGTLSNMPTTWAEMNRWVHDQRTVAPNTVIVRNTAPNNAVSFFVFLHGSKIAIVTEWATYIRDCGYVTRTTYDRLQRLVQPLGATVYRRKGVGYLVTRTTTKVGSGTPVGIYADELRQVTA